MSDQPAEHHSMDPGQPDRRQQPRESGRSARRRRRRLRRQQQIRVRSLAVLPSLLTIGNGIFGFAAVVLLAKAYAHLQRLPVDIEFDQASAAMKLAALCLLGGMVCDAFDGKVARMTGTAGKFGAELDSLCDAVSFCLAPAMFLRVLGEAAFGMGIDAPADIHIRLLWVSCAMYLACGLIRLARFNVESADDAAHNTFRGLPSPAAAGAVLSLFFFCWHFADAKTGVFAHREVMGYAVPVVAAAIALLMVSRFKYVHLFNVLFTGGRPLWQWLGGAALLGVLWALGGNEDWPFMLAVLFLLYVLSGPVLYVVNVLRFRGQIARRAARLRAVRAEAIRRGDTDKIRGDS